MRKGTVFQKGTVFVVTAPSGAGKTTLVAALLAADKDIHVSVSHTTRTPREGEIPGHHYHFVDRITFEAMLNRGEFLEYAEVYGHYYGTSERWIREQIAAGRDILLEIDWQGATQVRHAFPEAVGIFVLPPSIEALGERLRSRGKDTVETIDARLSVVRSEIDHVDEFDYIVVNEELERAVKDLIGIVRSERLRAARQLARRSRQIRAMQTHN